MIKLEKLYSTPEIFDPIVFGYGINIIMGEKSENDNKKIGVGKSISIEFINYCLLKRFSESRLSLIPKSLIEPETDICLDLIFKSYKMTIIRSFGNQEKVTIFKDGVEIVFEKVEEASIFLTNLYFEDYPVHTTRISFRNLLSPIIRDERSEFKDIIKSFDTTKLIPRDYKPHLFFLGFDVGLYSEITKVISEIEKASTYLAETKKILTNNGELRISDTKAHLNELDSEVLKINNSIEHLKNNESFDIMQVDLIEIESSLQILRDRQKAISFEIKQIKSLPEPENISEHELSALFNQFKKGLGDMVSKSIEEVKIFKNKIDSFRNTLVNNRLESLRIELSALNDRVRKLDNEYSNKISLIDDGTLLKDVKTALNIFNSKNEERNQLKSLLERYDSTERQKKNLQAKKLSLVSQFDGLIFEHQNIIRDFENTILEIHEKIMGNREAYFEIKTTNNKDSVEFILRTDDDGSHTTERIKVFIYDSALLFNGYTRKNHPGFLIHDNIFDKDDDSLEKSLNFMYQQDWNSPNEFQYILTLNRDLVESISEKQYLDFNIDDYKVATFTKGSRFLKNFSKYIQVSKKR